MVDLRGVVRCEGGQPAREAITCSGANKNRAGARECRRDPLGAIAMIGEFLRNPRFGIGPVRGAKFNAALARPLLRRLLNAAMLRLAAVFGDG